MLFYTKFSESGPSYVKDSFVGLTVKALASNFETRCRYDGPGWSVLSGIFGMIFNSSNKDGEHVNTFNDSRAHGGK